MKSVLPVLLFLFFFIPAFSQTKDSVVSPADSAAVLKNVTVTAYANSIVKLKNVPAAISVVNHDDLNRFDGTSLVPALNTVPGIRLEERSPGSLRLTMRGSALRSPFGVRDVKIYWDDFPFTDASGNSYLNLVDPGVLNNVEVIKGPPGSLYGAGTQGALILHSAYKNADGKRDDFSGSLSGGIYGKFSETVGWNRQSKNFFSSLQQSHIQGSGYRDQTSLRKDMLKWNGVWNISSKETLYALAFYTDLFYKTPGGLTIDQLNEDPSQARIPNVANNAYVRNKTPFAGITLKSQLTSRIKNSTSVVINHTSFTNPTNANFEKRSEWNESARTVFSYNIQKRNFNLEALLGGEVQNNDAHIDDYGNKSGMADSVQSLNRAMILQYFTFAQINLNFGRWIVQTGSSFNRVKYRDDDLADNLPAYNKNIGMVAAPRFSALYQLNANLSLYANIAKGFSPPTLAEILPSSGVFYADLQPEYGWNYETGIKGSALKNRLDLSAAVYYLKLQNAIVRRGDSTGGDYFVNSGSTNEKGIELWLKAYLIRKKTKYISRLNIFNSFSFQPYRFNEYVYDSSIYSGNKVTGVPRITNVTGADIRFKKDYFSNITLTCISAVPLNDSNTVYSKPYQLLQIKFGKQFSYKQYKPIGYIAIDNVLDETYSLGNDINSASGKYYNPAPKINFVIGGRIDF